MAGRGISFSIDGIQEIKRALNLVGPEVARQAGKIGNRRAMVYLRQKLREAAPINTKGPTYKYYKTKGGETRKVFYGRLRENIRFVSGRRSTRHQNTFYGVVGVGDAFWGGFLDRGTKNLSANQWFSRVVEREAAEAIRIQARSVGEAIPQACRKYANRKRKRRRR